MNYVTSKRTAPAGVIDKIAVSKRDDSAEPMPSYTHYAITEVEQQIKNILDKAVESVIQSTEKFCPLDTLVTMVLGGGYGRGEAGFSFSPEQGDRLIERFEIRVIVKRLSKLKRSSYNQILLGLSKQLSKQFKVKISFGKVIFIDQLPQLPLLPYWYELKWGHRVLWGQEHVLKGIRFIKEVRFPVSIALRTLLDHGNKLVLIKRKLKRKKCDYNSLVRELYQTRLVCGKCYLMIHQLYAPTMEECARNLRNLEFEDNFLGDLDFSRKYWQALQATFKLNGAVAKEEFKKHWEEVLADYEKFYFKLFSLYSKHAVIDERSFVRAIRKNPITRHDTKPGMKHFFPNLWVIGMSGVRGNWKWEDPTYRLYAAILGVLLDDTAGKGQLVKLADEALGISHYTKYLSRSLAFLRVWRGV